MFVDLHVKNNEMNAYKKYIKIIEVKQWFFLEMSTKQKKALLIGLSDKGDSKKVLIGCGQFVNLNYL